MNKVIRILSVTVGLGLYLSACGGGGSGVSTMPVTDAFDNSAFINPKMDILWVVDPSKSMYEEVEKVRNNIQAFVSDFITAGYEYRMAVISTAAWSHKAYKTHGFTYLVDDGEPVFARLHKGECTDYSNINSYESILSDENTSDIGPFIANFRRNFDVYGVDADTSGCGLVGEPFGDYSGVAGNIFNESAYDQAKRQLLLQYINDERPLQSVKTFLELDKGAPEGSRFVRDDAFLAVIIVSDEADGSRDDLNPSLEFSAGEPGNDAASYINDLTQLKGGDANRFAVYSIVDENIVDNIAVDAAMASGGGTFDINASQEDYVDNLGDIKNAILMNATAYSLECAPLVGSITVEVMRRNGSIDEVFQAPEGGSGWTYHAATQTISFSADRIPGPEDVVNVGYTPSSLSCSGVDQPRLEIANNEILENAAVGENAGTVVLRHRDSTGGVFSLENLSTSGAFSIDADTGVISLASLSIDTETRPIERVRVKIVLPEAGDYGVAEYEQEFFIQILDVHDAAPQAHDDSFTIIENSSGSTVLAGNVSFNDLGLDASEDHTYTFTLPSLGELQSEESTDGSFVLTIAPEDLGLAAGETEEITLNYTVADQGNGDAQNPNTDTAQVTILVQGINNDPYLDEAIDDFTYTATPSLGLINFSVSDITVSGTAAGNVSDLIDENDVAGFATDSTGAHFVTLSFPESSPFFEVDRFEIKAGSHSLGNVILQILSEDDRVLTREVLGVDIGGSSDLTVDMTRETVVGRKVRLLRPVGAKNPEGHQDLRLNEVEVYGTEVISHIIDLDDHFKDDDLGDVLTYFATDIYGEGPAPNWVQVVSGNQLRVTPPAGVDVRVGVLAQDTSGATAFTTFKVVRTASGAITNAGPIPLLALDDAKRGGVTLKRFGGENENADPDLDNKVRHGEIDNFIIDPYAGEIIRAAMGLESGVTELTASTYANAGNIPLVIRNAIPENQHNHFGDDYGKENGWSNTPIFIDEKYPSGDSLNPLNTNPTPGTEYPGRSFSGRCYSSAFIIEPDSNGKIYPCITGSGNNGPNDVRGYGETYRGFFVPAKDGIYRFRTTSMDDALRLLMSPTEYAQDLQPIITVTRDSQGMNPVMQSVFDGIPEAVVEAGGEFSPNMYPNLPARSTGHDTSIFFGSEMASYKNGYVSLKQGNIYVFEIRFGEGLGAVYFEFEYDRKDQGTNDWDGWKAIDASVMVPAEGSDAYQARVVNYDSGTFEVYYEAEQLFYDAEDDALDYTARLVNADGSSFVGAGGTDQLDEIGLVLNLANGLLSGTLNSYYQSLSEQDRPPRIVFKVQERSTSIKPVGGEAESLPIQFSGL